MYTVVVNYVCMSNFQLCYSLPANLCMCMLKMKVDIKNNMNEVVMA